MPPGMRQFAPHSRRRKPFRSLRLPTICSGPGLVNSLARPDGNTTGVSILATELDGKRQDILIEAVPGLRRMAALADSNTTPLRSLTHCRRRRAHAISSFQFIGSPEARRSQQPSTGRRHRAPQRSTFCRHRSSTANRQLIMDRAAALRLPAIYQWPEDGGGRRLCSPTDRASVRSFES